MVPVSVPTHSVPPARLPQDWELPAFDHQPRTRIVFGEGCIGRIGDLVRELGGRRVLLVTDPGIVRAGHAEAIRDRLLDAAPEVELFGRARENPDTSSVQECVEAARAFEPDLLVGLGGGSAMDTAKACNFLLTNGGGMKDYWGVGKARNPMLPFVAVPTTAGTGSECQSAALITDPETHQKMACLDPKAAARVALLDPDLTLSQPAGVTACTGVDALAHAIETAVTARRNALSRMYSMEALRLMAPSILRVLARPDDRAARGSMLLGASFAGCAIEASMLGAAHAAANPLTARFGVVHGMAVGLMLPSVIRFNGADTRVADAYADLCAGAGVARAADSAAEGLARWVEQVLSAAGMPASLAEVGVQEDCLPALALEAARQWTASFNPRAAGPEDFHELYRNALRPR